VALVRRVRLLFLLVAVTISACTSGAPSSSADTTPGAVQANATVVALTDGDTISVRIIGGNKEKVRLIGIDTPETKKPDTPVQCFGPEASAYTASLVPVGTKVRLERDGEARDKYGRLLAYVYRASDGLFVNLDVIRRGFARQLSIAPNTAHEPDFSAAVQAAQRDHIGLWAACTG
jgi:micrococcal nuclease